VPRWSSTTCKCTSRRAWKPRVGKKDADTLTRSVKGRPHYYSTKREEYAHVKFDLDAGNIVFSLLSSLPCLQTSADSSKTDLSTLFNWNTKQIFLYITATYPSLSPSTVPASEAIIWDAVIPASNAPSHPNTYIYPSTSKPSSNRKQSKSRSSGAKPYPAGTEPGILRLAGQKPKYQITDVTGKIAGRGNATLALKWNVQPWVGALVWANGKTVGRWKGLEGGEARFDFPPLKGTEVKKEDLKTETGAERRRGSPS